MSRWRLEVRRTWFETYPIDVEAESLEAALLEGETAEDNQDFDWDRVESSTREVVRALDEHGEEVFVLDE